MSDGSSVPSSDVVPSSGWLPPRSLVQEEADARGVHWTVVAAEWRGHGGNKVTRSTRRMRRRRR